MFCYLNSVHSSVIPPQKKSSHCHCVVAHGVPQATNETMDVGDEINHGGFSTQNGILYFWPEIDDVSFGFAWGRDEV